MCLLVDKGACAAAAAAGGGGDSELLFVCVIVGPHCLGTPFEDVCSTCYFNAFATCRSYLHPTYLDTTTVSDLSLRCLFKQTQHPRVALVSQPVRRLPHQPVRKNLRRRSVGVFLVDVDHAVLVHVPGAPLVLASFRTTRRSLGAEVFRPRTTRLALPAPEKHASVGSGVFRAAGRVRGNSLDNDNP